MLSREAHDLTTLLIARHILLAEAVEADAEYEYLTAVHEAPFDRVRPSTDDDDGVRRAFGELMAKLQLFPALFVDIDERIHGAWKRLQRVRPG